MSADTAGSPSTARPEGDDTPEAQVYADPPAPAYQVWLCGRCDNELVSTATSLGEAGDLACENCGCRFDSTNGAFISDEEEA